jgi:hypothetical protein
MFDLCFFSQTREAWREWKRTRQAKADPKPAP